MGSSLGPVLANIIMTELEDVVIKPFIANGTIKLQYFIRTLTLGFMLTSQVLSLGHIVFRGLEVLLLVHHASKHPINYHLKLTLSKKLLHGMISLNQLSIQ